MNCYVIGYIGSDRVGIAKEIASREGLDYRNMDRDIEKLDGRTIVRMVMTMGEHEYKNKEVDMMKRYDLEDGLVVACGDGVIHDGDCRDIMGRGQVVFVDEDVQTMWERAKDDETIPYAFMKDGNEARRWEKFCQLYSRRIETYRELGSPERMEKIEKSRR